MSTIKRGDQEDVSLPPGMVVAIRFINPTAGALTPASGQYNFLLAH